MLYKIYTENIPNYRDRVERICNGSFATGFTLYEAEGHWERIKEKSLIIEYVGDDTAETRAIVDFVAKQLKNALHQNAVLVQAIRNNSWIV